MDWLAGSRLHLLDIVVTRGLSFVPLYVLGFAQAPVFAYVLFVSFQAVLIHANVRWRFGPLRWVLATPQYHHWHHAVEPVDVNFAVHLPVIDALFGTLYLPADRWPSAYGVSGNPVPDGYWAQLVFPFRSRADAGAAEKSYFGADASKYDERSAFPGILNIETPILLAWAAVDPPRLVTEGEKLKARLCNSATHCPHTTVLKERASLASVFGLDGSPGSLAQPTLELVREIEARGLP